MYFNRLVKNGELVRVKRKNIQVSELEGRNPLRYDSNVSIDTIPQTNPDVKSNGQLSLSDSEVLVDKSELDDAFINDIIGFPKKWSESEETVV